MCILHIGGPEWDNFNTKGWVNSTCYFAWGDVQPVSVVHAQKFRICQQLMIKCILDSGLRVKVYHEKDSSNQ